MRKSKLSLFIKALLAVMLVLSILTLTACVSLGTGGTSGGDDEGTGENGGGEGKPDGGDNEGGSEGDENKPGSGDNTGTGDENKPGSGEGGEDAYETSLCIGVKGSVEALYSDYATLYHGTRAPILAAFDGPRTEPVRLWMLLVGVVRMFSIIF